MRPAHRAEHDPFRSLQRPGWRATVLCADCEVSAKTVPDPAQIESLARPEAMDRSAAGVVPGHHHIGVGCDARTDLRELQQLCAWRVAGRHVRGLSRFDIERSADRNPSLEIGPVRSAYARHERRRDPWTLWNRHSCLFRLRKFFHRTDQNLIPRSKPVLEQLRGASEDVPAARRIDRIETGDAAGDPERSTRDRPRRRPTRHRPLRRPAIEIREPAAKTEVTDDEAEIADAREEPVARDARVPQELGKVGPVLVAETDGELESGVRRPCRRSRIEGLESRDGRGVTKHHVQRRMPHDAGEHSLEGPHLLRGAVQLRCGDRAIELDQERMVSGGSDIHGPGHANVSRMNQHPADFLAEIARQAMIDKGLEPEYPAAALQQLKAIPGPAHETGLRDLRNLAWCSIDNDDSRDLDQLSWAEKVGNTVRALIAVADVDALVKKNSAIDGHAHTNTTSVYT